MVLERQGKHIFSFAVISDTHLNKDEFGTDSPFEVNQLANRRLRYVIDDLNHRDLTYVIHLGDVVHPVPSNEDLYQGAAARFFEQMESLKHPFSLIPGNHDVGDKPISWGPAGTIRQSFLDAWTEHFGDHYFQFSIDQISFIGVNAQLFGSGLPLEQVQKEWLLSTLERNQKKRIMLCTHYPPFLLHPNEHEHYDNLGKQGRSFILEMIEKYSIEALFAGHVHHFWYQSYKGCHCYLLPSTAFTRQDYSEMFRVRPREAFGRDDRSKLGYLIVHIYEASHEFEFVRCGGKELKLSSPIRSNHLRINPVSPSSNVFPVLGIDLRHGWCEKVEIPPTGGLDEFDRKIVRNDYPMLALWEMGVKHVRIPPSDLLNDSHLERMYDLWNLGFCFSLFSSDSEVKNLMRIVSQHSDLLISWEIAGHIDNCIRVAKEFHSVLETIPTKIFLSPLRSKSDIIRFGSIYYHVINHGFTSKESEAELLSVAESVTQIFDGVVFRCGINDSVFDTIHAANFLQQAKGIDASVHLRLTSDNPAEFQETEEILCGRLVEAMVLAWCQNFKQIFCDTFVENDRGYFPRIGLLDREYNPRAGAKYVRNLHALFTHLGDVRSWSSDLKKDGTNVITAEADHKKIRVYFPSLDRKQRNLFHINRQSGGYWMDWRNGLLVDNVFHVNNFPQIYLSRLDE